MGICSARLAASDNGNCSCRCSYAFYVVVSCFLLLMLHLDKFGMNVIMDNQTLGNSKNNNKENCHVTKKK